MALVIPDPVADYILVREEDYIQGLGEDCILDRVVDYILDPAVACIPDPAVDFILAQGEGYILAPAVEYTQGRPEVKEHIKVRGVPVSLVLKATNGPKKIVLSKLLGM